MYLVNGEYSYLDLPIDSLVDISEMMYFKKLFPSKIVGDRPVIDVKEIEAVALKTYSELEVLKHSYQEKGFKYDEVRFPYSTQRYSYTLMKNPSLRTNKIMRKFFEIDENKALFILSLFSHIDVKEQLDNKFREFYFQYRFISYICTHIFYESVHFDKKIRKTNARENLVLDQPVEYDSSPLIEMIPAEQSETDLTKVEAISMQGFLDNLSSDQLFDAYKHLTNRQQEILFMTYVKNMKDMEIANHFSVTIQAISKTRIKAIEQLRKHIRGEKKDGGIKSVV